MIWPGKILGILLAAAFLLQGVMPTGYMAGRSDEGVLTARICGSDGVWQIPLGQEGAPAEEHDKQRAGEPCTGAAFAKAIHPPVVLNVSAPTAGIDLYEAVYAPQDVPASASVLPPARGPPVSA